LTEKIKEQNLAEKVASSGRYEESISEAMTKQKEIVEGCAQYIEWQETPDNQDGKYVDYSLPRELKETYSKNCKYDSDKVIHPFIISFLIHPFNANNLILDPDPNNGPFKSFIRNRKLKVNLL
jgi:hypothetical protein